MGEPGKKKETKKEKKAEEQKKKSDSEKDTSPPARPSTRLNEEVGQVRAGSRHKKGVAENILKGLSNVFPCLGGLIKGLEKSDVFQERLKEIDKEVETRVRETPLKSSSVTGMPGFKGGSEKRPGVRRVRAALRDISVDIFDELNYIDVIAELPGVEAKEIKVDLSADILSISAGAAELKYFKKIRLPCKSKAILKKFYKNGVLIITLEKEI